MLDDEITAGETFSSFGALNRLDASKHFCSSSLRGGNCSLSLSLSLSLGTRIGKFLETGSAGCSPKTWKTRWSAEVDKAATPEDRRAFVEVVLIEFHAVGYALSRIHDTFSTFIVSSLSLHASCDNFSTFLSFLRAILWIRYVSQVRNTFVFSWQGILRISSKQNSTICRLSQNVLVSEPWRAETSLSLQVSLARKAREGAWKFSSYLPLKVFVRLDFSRCTARPSLRFALSR